MVDILIVWGVRILLGIWKESLFSNGPDTIGSNHDVAKNLNHL